MKRAPHPAQPFRHNSGEGWPFRKAALGSNEVASAACGWRLQGQRGNRMAAQPQRKAGFTSYHYTAKRMIYPIELACMVGGFCYRNNTMGAKDLTSLMDAIIKENCVASNACRCIESAPLNFLEQNTKELDEDS